MSLTIGDKAIGGKGKELLQPLDVKATTLKLSSVSGRVDFGAGCAIITLNYALQGGGLAMTLRTRKQDPLAEVVRSQHEEINKYKWIESEKAGNDIGWERASQEWLERHFPEWKRVRWRRAVQEALHEQDSIGPTGLN